MTRQRVRGFALKYFPCKTNKRLLKWVYCVLYVSSMHRELWNREHTAYYTKNFIVVGHQINWDILWICTGGWCRDSCDWYGLPLARLNVSGWSLLSNQRKFTQLQYIIFNMETFLFSKESVCKVLLLYFVALRRYLRICKGGNYMPPPSGRRTARRPSGRRVKIKFILTYSEIVPTK